MISCLSCRDLLAEHALGDAGVVQGEGASATLGEIEEHLAACPVCRQELSELRAAWSAVAASLPAVELPPDLWERIAVRLGDHALVAAHVEASIRPHAQQSSGSGVVLTPRQRRFSYALAAALAFVLATATLVFLSRTSRRDESADLALAELTRRLGRVEQIERLLSGGAVRMVSLRTPRAGEQGRAVVLWDQPGRQWHFYAFDLPHLPADRGYQLWAVDRSGRTIPGPLLRQDAASVASALFALPTTSEATWAKVQLTEEPAAGSGEPTGSPILEATW